jgi:hypothetical protein
VTTSKSNDLNLIRSVCHSGAEIEWISIAGLNFKREYLSILLLDFEEAVIWIEFKVESASLGETHLFVAVVPSWKHYVTLGSQQVASL